MDDAPTLGLDLDATLIHGALGSVIADLGRDIEVEQGITGIHDQVIAEGHRLMGEDPALAYDWQATVARICAAQDAVVPFDIAERLAEVADERTLLLEETTVPVLRTIGARGWRRVVLTNGWRRYQDPALRAVGLTEVIDDVVTADAVGAPKPDPAMFAAARGEHGGGLVHLGDRLDDDVLGAHGAGARAILYCPWAPAAVHGPCGEVGQGALRDFLRDLAQRQSARVDPATPQARPDAVITTIEDLPALLPAFAEPA